MRNGKLRSIIIPSLILIGIGLLCFFVFKWGVIKKSLLHSDNLELVKLGHGDISDMPMPTNLFVVKDLNTGGSNLLGAFRLNQNSASQSVQPLEGYAKLSHQTGTTSLGLGIIGNVEMNSPADVSEIRSVQGGGVFKGAGNVKNWTSFYSIMGVNNGTGVIDNAYGLFMNTWPQKGITIRNKWGVYINDSAAKNYFAGEVNAKHLSGNSGKLTPTVYLTNASATILGNDLAGEITLNTQKNGIKTGKILDVFFACKYANAPKITLTCANENSPKLISNIYVTATKESFTINIITDKAKSISGIYKWNYIVVQ